MGNVVPLVIARAVKRGFLISNDAFSRLTAVDELSRKDYHHLPYELVSVKKLGLHWACYKDIVHAAHLRGYQLCPGEVALHLVASGPMSPVVHVAMLPNYQEDEGTLLCVSNMGTMAHVELVRIKKHVCSFSPYSVFAFLRTS